MKTTKHLIFAALLAVVTLVSAQNRVGIGADDPKGVLDVTSTDSGIIFPRVSNTTAVTSPVNGMVIYDISASCIKAYENNAWSNCFNITGSLTVSFDAFAGTYENGTAFNSGNTFSVIVTNNTSGVANLTFQNSDVTLSGISGTMSISGTSPTSATLNPGESQTITYTLDGTPTSDGTLQADWSNGTLSAVGTTTVITPISGSANFDLPQTVSIFSVKNTSPTIDIQGVLDNATNQFIVNVPYTAGTGAYAAYTSAAISLVGEGGDTNDITISYSAGTFSATGSIAVTVTVGGGDISHDILQQLPGINTILGTLDFQLNGLSQGDIHIEATGGVPDIRFGDGSGHDFLYLPVEDQDGNIWLNNNLGADYANANDATNFNPTKQATGLSDHLAYGSLFQWGRYSDGHELIDWTNGTSGTPNTNTSVAGPIGTDSPTHSSFVTTDVDPRDWLNPQDNTPYLWQGTVGENNPCPQLYRLPTSSEFQGLTTFSGGTISNNANAASGILKLPSAGQRFHSSALLFLNGSEGYYWTSSVTLNSSNYNSRYFYLSSSAAGVVSNRRGEGFSVRCIKN